MFNVTEHISALDRDFNVIKYTFYINFILRVVNAGELN